MCASCVHLWIKLLAQVEFSSSLNQTAEYLQMKGCTSKCLLLDTEGVIVSPSADLPFNGGLSDGSHAKVCVALLYLDGCSAEWPKCFTPAPNLRAAFTSLLLLGIVKAEAQSPCAKSTAAAISACKHANVKPLCEFISPISCHASITLCRVLAGCSGCALVFQHPISIAQKIRFFFPPFHFLPQQQGTGTALKCRIIIP